MGVGHAKDGFTIVELLIVVVVIAILASFTVVTYNGIQQKAKTAASLSTVDKVQGKALAWNVFTGSFPDVAQLRTNSIAPPTMDTPGGAAGPQEANLGDPNVAIGASMNEVRSENGKVVTYEPCWGGTNFTGARITYWNFETSSAQTKVAGTCP